ncbi:uncharacterized protein VTP21DRAFT_9396 [Calcarisporiella thermophila]|uniref:uncharacterized protein n=1 Tax=Calcarisporiella thermophila TaxID=911321 RepID=UPI0037443A53
MVRDVELRALQLTPFPPVINGDITDTSTPPTPYASDSDTASRPKIDRHHSSPPDGKNLPGSATRKPHSRHKRRPVSFHARTSRLDSVNIHSQEQEFRGFFTLFWLAMAFYVILTVVENLEKRGTIISLGLFSIFSQDALALMASDLVMVVLTGFGVILQKCVAARWIGGGAANAVQHLYQAAFLSAAIYWTFWRDWPWVQSGFFVLHTLVMLMKLHSYCARNNELAAHHLHFEALEKELDELTAKLKKLEDIPHDERHTLECHVEHIRNELKELDHELCPGKMRYPNNLTWANYIEYLFVPTLVYELEYPRTERVRPWYVFEKTVATLGTFLLLYLTAEHYIIPVLQDVNLSMFRMLLQLLFPFMIGYLLIFYIIFECICNLFAELSCFADRNFYDDFWNSTSWDEFARKWNKPVHRFLLRHVYHSSVEAYNLSKINATLLTFLLSSCLHELVMIVVSRRFRMLLFFLQMLQVPLMFLSRVPVVRQRKILGNVVFWIGMLTGPPLLGIVYSREAFKSAAVDAPDTDNIALI